MTYTVENRGGAAIDNVALRLWGSLNKSLDSTDRELAIRTVPPLSPGGKHSATTTVTAGTSGVYYLIGHVDANNAITEINESNTHGSRGGTVQ